MEIVMLVYFYLFVFLDFGFIILKNCVLMGLMYIGLEELFDGLQCLVVFYVECVVGGVGLIVIGGIVFNKKGVVYQGVLVLNDVV